MSDRDLRTPDPMARPPHGPTGLRPAAPGGPPAATLRAFVDGLVVGGVSHAVVCPGSRSTPLALALAADPRIRLLVHVDERAGSFLALGLAKTARRPVAFLATSGTASVNAHPAVVEARYGRVPLVVLTADRPPELRGRSAPQTIDQIGLFGTAARLFVEMPVPEAGPEAEAHWRSVGARAAATAAGSARGAPAGPVHLNFPFREPLVPEGDLARGSTSPADATVATDSDRRGLAAASPADVDAIAASLARARRPLLVCGPADDPALPPALASLAAALDGPIVADPLSGMRNGTHDRSRVLVRGDLVVRRGPWLDAHEPDLVLRVGGVPTSKPVALMLASVRPELVVVDVGEDWPEPGPCPATVLRADPATTLAAVARALGGPAPGPSDTGRPGDAAARLRDAGLRPAVEAGWCAAWRSADAAASAAVADALARVDEPYEGRVLDALDDALPAGSLLWLGSSMPVRDADTYLAGSARPMRVMSNRGANGIDGVVSSAIGAAAVHPGPVIVVLGDLSFLHDLNALVGARIEGIGLTVLVIDNDGGGIFSFLPQATTVAPGAGLPERFERLFGAAHGIGSGLGVIAEAMGARSVDLGESARDAASDRAAIVAAVREATARDGVTVIRYATDRARNVEIHRAVAAEVREALAALVVAAGTPGAAREAGVAR